MPPYRCVALLERTDSRHSEKKRHGSSVTMVAQDGELGPTASDPETSMGAPG